MREELKIFIEQNCSGKEPSDLIMEAINSKIELYEEDADEVLAFVEKCIQGPTLEQKAEIARQASEAEAERQARIAEARAKAESDAKNAEIAAEKAKKAFAEADTARQKADEAKAKLQSENNARLMRKMYMIVLIVVVVLGVVGAAAYLALANKKSVAQLASEAIYNTINNNTIDDIQINTDDVPSADPSIIIDPQGDIKAQLEQYYETVLDLDAGFYKIIDHNKVGLADPSGKIIQKPKYDEIMAKNNQGLIRVAIDGRIGFLNLKGVEVLTPKYTSVEEPQNGLMKVSIDNKYGFINATTLKEVTPCEYTYIYPLKDGKYKVLKGNLSSYLNPDGTIAQ